MQFERILEDIGKKKELQSLSPDFIMGVLELYIEKEKPNYLKDLKWLYNSKSRQYKTVVKDVRKILRDVYGAFKRRDFHKRAKILDEIHSVKDIEKHVDMLKLHSSTNERLPYYFEIYGNILERVDRIESILDLGAGLNPFSIPFMHFDVPKYYAVEISDVDSDFINLYFKKVNVEGHAFSKDLTKVDNLPEVDVCLMLKLLDTLETLKRDVSRELVEKINARWIVVSFATKSLGGKKVISKRRLSWFRKIIKSFDYSEFEVPNEYFFVIRKKD